jgi:hypothetical protein
MLEQTQFDNVHFCGNVLLARVAIDSANTFRNDLTSCQQLWYKLTLINIIQARPFAVNFHI